MARWRLQEAHYIFAYPPDLVEEGVEWEYEETDRTTGRARRKRFKVPFYCDPDSIVCWEGKGQPGDIVFEGDPTPSMLPIDAEAKEVTKSFEAKWGAHPIDSLPGQGFSASILGELDKKLEALMRISPTPVVSSGVSREEFETLKNQLAQLMAENAALKSAEPAVQIDDAEPLGPADGSDLPPEPPTKRHGPQMRMRA